MNSLSNAKHEVLSEIGFNNLLPDYLKFASRLYFTPIDVAQQAAIWLTENGEKKILDIGSGVGKFCVAAAINVDSHFYGVEYRKSLNQIGKMLVKHYNLTNVTLLQANILDITFLDYDGFYIFNPFYENLEKAKRLNDEVELKEHLYLDFLKHTEDQLNLAKPGTKLVTYHGNNFEVPNSYKKINEAFNGDLKLWAKQ